MPQLARLANRGAWAEAVEPVLPAALYPVHATLVTGLRPSRHELVGDELLGAQGLHVRGIDSERRIRALTLWRAAQTAGHSVAALNWPSTRGASVALLLPDLGIPPRESKEPWVDLMRGHATPWIIERLKRIDPTLASVGWPSSALRDSLVTRLACEIAAQPVTPALWLLAFEETGTALARDGPGSDGERQAFARVDAALGRVLRCFERAGLADDTTFLIVGDRSLLEVHTLVFPNAILESVGLITPASVSFGPGVASWDAFVLSFGGAAVVYAESETDALLARRALEEQVRRTSSFRIVSAAELQSLHADPQAWFGLQGAPGFGLGKTVRGPFVDASPVKGLGGYLPSHAGASVGFVAWGAGVRPGVQVPKLSQLDVAPTVARLLGFELPDIDGSALVGILGSLSAPAREGSP
jgi:predicted AlkP superfamily pyrophosphatase or phosphodiesterase